MKITNCKFLLYKIICPHSHPMFSSACLLDYRQISDPPREVTEGKLLKNICTIIHVTCAVFFTLELICGQRRSYFLFQRQQKPIKRRMEGDGREEIRHPFSYIENNRGKQTALGKSIYMTLK